MGNKYGMNTTEANAGLAARNLEHWRQEVGKLHSQVDRLKHDRDIGAKDYCALMERHDAAVVENARLTQINADLVAANVRLVVRVEALRAIADLTDISCAEFKRLHPELNAVLDEAGYDNWGPALSDFAARAWIAGGAE